jgi:RNA polymerase sigma factor (sigma-70 family)
MTKNEYIELAIKEEQPRLLNFIRKRVPDRDEAEDILQDVFTQMVFSFESIQSVERIGSWLYSTARNRITDHYRKKKPERFSDQRSTRDNGEESLGLEDIIPAELFHPEDELMRSVVQEEILEALAELPAEQRDVFTMHVFDDMSFREIEAVTGIPVNTLLSRKRYAILHLRSRLEQLYEQIKNY